MTSLLDHERVIINQRPKLIELVNEYRIRDEDGADIGVIRQEGQSKLKKVARFVGNLDQFMTHKLAVYDATGGKVLELVRPRKFLKSKLEVSDGTGRTVGAIVQENVIGKIRFGFEDPSGLALGRIQAENWRAWDFAIVDSADREVGRITKTWEGLAKTLFTTADDYVLELSSAVAGPLRMLAFASAAAVDTALKQDARGLN
jgi:uncharacterized protein YxjI